ncbi:MAG: winged helix-turn-helix domain-containing protein [Tannerellaceae bacterium]|nr:winged helix-turn-helix domain-containing protein [Tannerellaceae bacterium]
MARKGDYLEINDLDSIWNEMLRQQNIHMETGVKYRHRSQAETIYSNKDSLFFKTAEFLEEYTTGFEWEISLHGYYKVSFKTLYYYSPNKFNKLFLIGLGLVLSLILCWKRIVKFIRIKLTPLAKPEPEDEFLRVRKSKSYPITDTITLDVERNLLWAVDGREVNLTNKMMEFMQELLKSPYFHALNKDLWKNIWNTEEDTSNVLTQLVSNLRDELRRFPELELRNIRKKGYRLIILPKEKHPKIPSPPDEKK